MFCHIFYINMNWCDKVYSSLVVVFTISVYSSSTAVHCLWLNTGGTWGGGCTAWYCLTTVKSDTVHTQAAEYVIIT